MSLKPHATIFFGFQLEDEDVEKLSGKGYGSSMDILQDDTIDGITLVCQHWGRGDDKGTWFLCVKESILESNRGELIQIPAIHLLQEHVVNWYFTLKKVSKALNIKFKENECKWYLFSDYW